ncbi:hypothetical protein [Phenylobacterium sp.]|uniref:hypothetical protein n=1 Tax=Phenylobacterium sp. TaxID=1871053 RepID=UPI0035B38060
MTYTLVITGADGAQQASRTDYRDDEAVVGDVRHMLSPEQPRIVIGRGMDEPILWLGAWEWREGAPPAWIVGATPERSSPEPA